MLGETGEDERALALLQEAVELASSSGQPGLQAEALNDLGNVQLRADALAALASYQASATLAESARLPRLRVRALVNAARAETLGGEGEAAAASLQQASDLLDTMPADQDDSLERLAAAGQALELARLRPRLSGAGRSPAAPGPDIERGLRRAGAT